MSGLQDSAHDAFYEYVLQSEEAWKDLYRRIITEGKDPQQDHEIAEKTAAFNNSVERYLHFFPDDKRLTGVLIRTGSANLSVGLKERAIEFWHHVLLSSSSTVVDQAAAVRSMVYLHVEEKNYGEVIEMVTHFLQEEKWGDELHKELAEVLGISVIYEGQRLAKIGNAVEGADLLWQFYSNFEKLPNRDQLLRDSGYYYAVAKSWQQALEIARTYLRAEYETDREQMLYLLAKAQDSLLDTENALVNYLNLYKNYPQHILATYCFEHIIDLATSRNNFKILADIYRIAGDRDIKANTKVAHYMKAFDYALRSSNSELAAELLTTIEKTVSDPLLQVKILINRGKIDLARDRVKSGVSKLRQALDLTQSRNFGGKEVRRQRAKLVKEIHHLLIQIKTPAKIRHSRRVPIHLNRRWHLY